jgi:gliding motility-associated-like protein
MISFLKIKYLLQFSLLFLFIASDTFSQVNCCCGGSGKELNFPGLDFEFPPEPAPGGWITYTSGSSLGPWLVNKGGVDHVDKDYLNTGNGNPNGSSNFVDLYGSTPPGAGGITYTLTGLNSNYHYTLEFYYAKFDVGGSFKANILVENGAWLNVNLTATNPGNIIWLKASYEFVAKNSSTTLQFNDAGSSGCICGVLIDDIKIYECPQELPIINDPPVDLEVECDNQVPPPQKLDITDFCDPNPIVTFTEKKVVIDSCTKKINRSWEIKDKCGNYLKEDQVIDIIDKSGPEFMKLPEDLSVDCHLNVASEFNQWISNHGNAIATDICGIVQWRATYDHFPSNNCDFIIVQFESIDHCGNTTIESATFTVIDSVPPKFIKKAEDRNYFCISNYRDSLKNWLTNFGYSKTDSDCGSTILSSNFNGDSTKNPILVTFYSNDNCGNVDSCIATFSNKLQNDTVRLVNFSCSFNQNSIDTFYNKINGCDSITIVENLKKVGDSTYIQFITCDASLNKFDTLQLLNVLGCDSLVFIERLLKPTSITNIQIKDCAIFSHSIDTLILTGQFCDSIIIREFIPLSKDSILIQRTTCDKSEEGIIVDSLKNRFGCDSIVTISTVYTSVQNTLITSFECGLQKNYVDTIIKSNGICDSLIITTHVALKLDTVINKSNTCDLSKVGKFYNLLKNSNGCDSLVIDEVFLSPTDSIFISMSSCLLSQVGTKSQNFINQFGCDSVVTTVTSFIPSDSITINISTCDISKKGMDTIILKNVFGCDSLIITTTTFIPSDTLRQTNTTCNPNSVRSDTLLFKNSQGCDSIILSNIIYVPLKLLYDLDSITCFNANNGAFRIINSSDFSSSFELVMNNTNLGSINQLNNLKPGNYFVFIKDSNGCLTDSIYFNLDNPIKLEIELGQSFYVDKGSLVQLNLQSNRKLSNILWGPTKIINCNNCQTVQFKADEDNWIFAQGIDDLGCVEFDSIFIKIRKSNSVFAPNSFSPNGDNINDYFYLHGDASSLVIELNIFDRWGNLLFESRDHEVNNPLFGWNGTFKEQKMNPGTYVFYAKIKTPDQEIISMKGDINLLR